MPNRLANETSPYLLQHANNPVAWWPWCEQALERARDEDKPVLLSVGYSACHWCHVMAHESFEDEATAALMNARFVNIKVDREERPDIDKVYQLAHQIMTQRPGGWPLTVMLDPASQAPFMAGTYFPREARMGMPAFGDVLRQVADWYAANQQQLAGQKQRLAEVFARLEPNAGAVSDRSALDVAGRELAANFDSEYGGFSGAPKFPHPASLELAEQLADRGDTRAGEMQRFTLARMAAGGLFDHLGGGFFRYCVDARWQIPHFEKMLYDNGPLLSLYARAGAGDPEFATAARATADWALREMRAPGGGFYSSLDADSEGREGAFYVWNRDEAAPRLGDDYALFAAAYGLDRAANFENAWHLQRVAGTQELAARFELTPEAVEQRLTGARTALLAARGQRVRPARDDKILTAWNALLVTGLAAAGRCLDRPDYLDAAAQALDFIRAELWRGDRLLAVHAAGRSHTPAFLDDYAFLLQALLAVLASRWDSGLLQWAQSVAEAMLVHFEDPDAGGFYFTADDHEALLHRPKPLADESTPAGNGIAAQALLKLGWLLGEPRYLSAAERTLALASEPMQRYPLAHASLLGALKDYRQPPPVVILRGDDQPMAHWRRAIANHRVQAYAIPADAADLPPVLAEKAPRGEVVAYICRASICSPPVTDLQGLSAQLADSGSTVSD